MSVPFSGLTGLVGFAMEVSGSGFLEGGSAGVLVDKLLASLDRCFSLGCDVMLKSCTLSEIHQRTEHCDSPSP